MDNALQTAARNLSKEWSNTTIDQWVSAWRRTHGTISKPSMHEFLTAFCGTRPNDPAFTDLRELLSKDKDSVCLSIYSDAILNRFGMKGRRAPVPRRPLPPPPGTYFRAGRGFPV